MTEKKIAKPTSAKQVASNRQNACKSQGPATTTGKAEAAKNALRHGIYATRAVAIPRGVLAEDPTAVEGFIEDCIRDLDPDGPIQQLVARQIAVHLLRVLRFEAYEAIRLGQAGRLTGFAALIPRPEEEDETHQALGVLEHFQMFMVSEGSGPDGDTLDVDLLEQLLLRDPGVAMNGLPGIYARDDAVGSSDAAWLRRLVEEVWVGDWAAAANWATTASTPLRERLDEFARGRELASASAGDYLDALTIVYSRLDNSLDRTIARYQELRGEGKKK